MSANGHLQIWDTTTGTAHNIQKAAPKVSFIVQIFNQKQFSLERPSLQCLQWVWYSQVDSASPARSGLAWHPDGSLLAVSDTNNGITVYEKLSWDPVIHLDGHTAPVNCLKFSPNGEQQCCGCRKHKVLEVASHCSVEIVEPVNACLGGSQCKGKSLLSGNAVMPVGRSLHCKCQPEQ